jgi:hypothetical protein
MKAPRSIKDISRGDEPLAHIESHDQPPLPPPYDKPGSEAPMAPLKAGLAQKVMVLDDTVALNLPVPKTKEEEDELVRKFLGGVE